jgi:rubredoxin
VKCPLCGYSFEEDRAKDACGGCPMAGNCHMLRCPNCGYDIPKEPKLVKAFKAWRKRENGN